MAKNEKEKTGVAENKAPGANSPDKKEKDAAAEGAHADNSEGNTNDTPPSPDAPQPDSEKTNDPGIPDAPPSPLDISYVVSVVDPETAATMPDVVDFCKKVVHIDLMAMVASGVMPTISDEHIAEIAKNPSGVEVAARVLAEAKRLKVEAERPAHLSDEEVAAAAYQRLTGKYGPDFVTAKKGNNKMYFSRRTWNGLPKSKNGWVEITKEMPETQA